MSVGMMYEMVLESMLVLGGGVAFYYLSYRGLKQVIKEWRARE